MKKTIILLMFGSLLAACHENLEERTAREAKEYTQRNCPTPVNNNTRTDSLTFDKTSLTLAYWYTLCGNADNDTLIENNKEDLVNTILQEVKTSTQLKVYKEAGYNIRYAYHSESNPQKVLLDVTFTKKDF